jgi:hypothetical protein
MATAEGVYTTISGVRQSQRLSIWSLRHNVSGICKALPHGTLYVEQMAVYEAKQLGDCRLCNVMYCESIS